MAVADCPHKVPLIFVVYSMGPEVLGLYIEGMVFKWQPYDDYVDELPTSASKLKISDVAVFSLLVALRHSQTLHNVRFLPLIPAGFERHGS
jgi:hypothetical protein